MEESSFKCQLILQAKIRILLECFMLSTAMLSLILYSNCLRLFQLRHIITMLNCLFIKGIHGICILFHVFGFMDPHWPPYGHPIYIILETPLTMETLKLRHSRLLHHIWIQQKGKNENNLPTSRYVLTHRVNIGRTGLWHRFHLNTFWSCDEM